MTKEEIKREVQAQVDFKINELKTGLKNAVDRNWAIAFQQGSPKHSNYYEAFREMMGMLKKEAEMATPFDKMAAQKKRVLRDAAVGKLVANFCKRGDRDYYIKERLIVSIIEDAQRI